MRGSGIASATSPSRARSRCAASRASSASARAASIRWRSASTRPSASRLTRRARVAALCASSPRQTRNTIAGEPTSSAMRRKTSAWVRLGSGGPSARKPMSERVPTRNAANAASAPSARPASAMLRTRRTVYGNAPLPDPACHTLKRTAARPIAAPRSGREARRRNLTSAVASGRRGWRASRSDRRGAARPSATRLLEASPRRPDATQRAADTPGVERGRMIATCDLGQERRRPVELARFGQELHEAEPPSRLHDPRGHHALDEFRGASRMLRPPVGDDRGAVVGEARFELERLKEVEEELCVFRPGWCRAAPHVAVAVLAQEHPELALGPPPAGRSGRVAVRDAGDDHRAAELLSRSEKRVAQARIDDLGERRVELDHPLERPEPVVDPTPLGVVARGESKPVALVMVAPVLAGDVVLDDPSLLRGRSGEEDGGRNAEAIHRTPLRLVPGARRLAIDVATDT